MIKNSDFFPSLPKKFLKFLLNKLEYRDLLAFSRSSKILLIMANNFFKRKLSKIICKKFNLPMNFAESLVQDQVIVPWSNIYKVFHRLACINSNDFMHEALNVYDYKENFIVELKKNLKVESFFAKYILMIYFFLDKINVKQNELFNEKKSNDSKNQYVIDFFIDEFLELYFEMYQKMNKSYNKSFEFYKNEFNKNSYFCSFIINFICNLKNDFICQISNKLCNNFMIFSYFYEKIFLLYTIFYQTFNLFLVEKNLLNSLLLIIKECKIRESFFILQKIENQETSYNFLKEIDKTFDNSENLILNYYSLLCDDASCKSKILDFIDEYLLLKIIFLKFHNISLVDLCIKNKISIDFFKNDEECYWESYNKYGYYKNKDLHNTFVIFLNFIQCVTLQYLCNDLINSYLGIIKNIVGLMPESGKKRDFFIVNFNKIIISIAKLFCDMHENTSLITDLAAKFSKNNIQVLLNFLNEFDIIRVHNYNVFPWDSEVKQQNLTTEQKIRPFLYLASQDVVKIQVLLECNDDKIKNIFYYFIQNTPLAFTSESYLELKKTIKDFSFLTYKSIACAFYFNMYEKKFHTIEWENRSLFFRLKLKKADMNEFWVYFAEQMNENLDDLRNILKSSKAEELENFWRILMENANVDYMKKQIPISNKPLAQEVSESANKFKRKSTSAVFETPPKSASKNYSFSFMSPPFASNGNGLQPKPQIQKKLGKKSRSS